MFTLIGTIAKVALRNMLTRRMNLAVGFLLLMAALLLTVTRSIQHSVEQGTRRSIIDSLVGHLQVVSDKQEDWEGIFMMSSSNAQAHRLDVAATQALVRAHPNVKDVLPINPGMALFLVNNPVDRLLERLRDAVRAEGTDPSRREERERLARHVQYVFGTVVREMERTGSRPLEEADRVALERAASAEFWSGFAADPSTALEFLENKAAPQLATDTQDFLKYLGTSLQEVPRVFPRIKLVRGAMVPEGQRGMLLPEFIYADVFRIGTVRRFEELRVAVQERGRSIAEEPDLKRLVRQNRQGLEDILHQLDEARARELVARLQQALPSSETDLGALLTRVVDVTDEDFAHKHEVFQKEVVPRIDLFWLKVGEQLLLKGFDTVGRVHFVAVRLHGTFAIDGMEGADSPTYAALVDLVTGSELQGLVPGAPQEAPAEDLTLALAVESPEQLEASLAHLEATAGPAPATTLQADALLSPRTERASTERYTEAEREASAVISLALVLKEPERLEATLKELQGSATQAGLGLQVVPWSQAAGRFDFVISAVLSLLSMCVLGLFAFVAVIVNNGMMLAVLQRVQELGTLRAVGASRGFVVALTVMEILWLGLVFGGLGTLLGLGLIQYLSTAGIPAGSNSLLTFFFSGTHLYPSLHPTAGLFSMLTVLGFASAASLYPALRVSRILPRLAMEAAS